MKVMGKEIWWMGKGTERGKESRKKGEEGGKQRVKIQ